MTLITSVQIERVRELYDKALCVQALREAETIAPLRQWNWSAEARVLAGRLAANIGAPRLAAVMHYRAWREFPDDPDALYFYSRVILERRGPLPAWEFLRSIGDLPNATDQTRADWYAQHAAVAIQFRDFDTAEAWLDRAQELAPKRPWLWIERSSLLESEDRYKEALAAARKALELRPGYRPAVQSTAHLLQVLDRDEEALSLLESAAASSENSPIVLQLAMLQYELQRYDEAEASLDLCERYSPLIEKPVRRWIAARRSDIACAKGNLNLAIEQAKLADNPFHKTIVENLSKPENRTGQRVLLPVGFVRQHHLTCAPATLAAISGFWSMAADHLAVVEEICYDGTPHHSERNWADTHGWVTKEFTVTWDSAVALIDRGVPFTLTTVEPDSAHLQAVVGYDSRRRTLLVRDPYVYYVVEMMADAAFEKYRSTGPRGMAMVPADKAHLLEGLDLPDVKLWDCNNAVQRALAIHDREAATRLCGETAVLAPGHWLAINARRSLAAYDANTVAALQCFEELLVLFPDDPNLLLSKLSCLRTLGRRAECLEILATLCRKRDCEPLFWQMYAFEVGRDARQHDLAQRLLRRTIRFRPRDAASYSILGNLLWDRGNRQEATELYRFSACLADKQESFARSFFIASQHLGQRAKALSHLQARFDRLGKLSSWPIRTLFWAMEELGQADDGFDLLERAIALRPEDGDLLLFATTCNARYGRIGQADALLSRAKGRCAAGAFLRTSAELAELRGDLTSARQQWEKVCEAQPLDIDANSRLARLIAETESPTATLDYLRKACERFPHNYGLKQLFLGWLRDECPPEDAEPFARELVNAYPEDVWARRELAITLLRQQQNAEALAELQTAQRIDPSDGNTYTLIGRVHLALQQIPEARAAFREAITRSVDTEYALAGLLDACDTTEQKRESLGFFRDELKRQTIVSDSLMTYRERAAELVEPLELLELLREARSARQDLWQAHSALIQQLMAVNRLDEALEAAQKATELFPLLPQVWLDLAQVNRLRGDRAGELKSLEQAVQISPSYGYAIRELAGAHCQRGNLQKARELLEQAIARAPLDGFNHGCLADILFRQEHKEQAIQTIRRAVTLLPGYEWAWGMLRRWCAELKRPQLVEEVAREIATRRPGEARSWLILAENLSPEKREDRLAAVEKAVALSPRAIDAHDLRAQLLADSGRVKEALAACAPAVFSERGQTPAQLHFRAGIILWNDGQRDDAITLMRTVTNDSPTHYTAWLALADWYRTLGDLDRYAEVTERWIKIFPHDTKVLGYYSEACERTGKKADAKAAYGNALRLAPDYTYAAFSLFDLHLQDNELDAAEKVLAIMPGSAEPELVVFRQLQLACRRGDSARAEECLEQLCMLKFDRWPVFEQAIEAMVGAGLSDQVEQILQAAAMKPGVNSHAGEALMARRTKRGAFKEGRKLLAQLSGRGDVCATAARTLIEAAAEAKREWLALKLIKKYRSLLRSRDDTWGGVGFALTTLGQYHRCIVWLSDWQQRPGAMQWMLSNLIMCQRRLGREQESKAAIKYALTLPPDGTNERIKLWSALSRAEMGDVDGSWAMLKSTDLSGLDAYWKFLEQITRAMCLVPMIDPDAPREGLKQVREQLEQAEKGAPGYQHTPELARPRRTLLRMIRRRVGVWQSPSWWWRRMIGGAGTSQIGELGQWTILVLLILFGVGILRAIVTHLLK